MSSFEAMRIAVVGCGDISRGYGESLKTGQDKVKIIGAFDLDTDKVKAFTNNYGGKVYDSLEKVFADPEVETVVNLTSHLAHAAVSTGALSAGKHVHSEKPLAATREDGKSLLALAEGNGVRLSCSPFTFLGEAQETARKAIQDGMIGKPLIVYAEMNWERIESWHPSPEGFYQAGAGPMLDVGVYPLSVLTTILGPVTSVLGDAAIMLPDRKVVQGQKAGKEFRVTTPDQVTAFLTFASGVKARLTASFLGYSHQGGVEFHGEKGSIFLSGSHNFDASVEVRTAKETGWKTIPYVTEPFPGIEWKRVLDELAESLRTGSPQRCTGRQAYHVLDICLSILESAEEGRAVAVDSTFSPPPPKYF